MNSQNIVKFWGSRLNLQLDSSEFHDYEIYKTDLDYDDLGIDLNNTIQYNTLSINTTGLTNSDCVRNTISLVEFDNRVNDSGYTYSSLTWTLPYSAFTSTLSNSDIILQNDVYEFTASGNTHFFIIDDFNGFLSNPFGLNISGFTTGITGASYSCVQKLGNVNNCCPQDIISNAKPWVYQINHGGGVDNCSYRIKRRTEKGWTIDLVLNKNNNPWSDGKMIYYLGVRNENDLRDYTDNNLSFSFTNDGRIEWKSIRYSGVCVSDSGYTETFYMSSGQTPILCDDGTSSDFNVTISFERDKYYENCDIENKGGWNDLITERTLLTSVSSWLTGVTPTYLDVENLNKKWADERNRRLGTLKIYLNGRAIYKLKNWEEVIPSTRGFQPLIQSWGGGTIFSGGVHNKGISCFDFKRIRYYEEPLNFVRVRHNYLVNTKPNYNINECNEKCVDVVSQYIPPSPTPTPSVTPTPTPSTSVTPTPTPSTSVTPTPTPSTSSIPIGNFLLQQNGSKILQENSSGIIITN